jgi:hypothetical protein
MRFAVGILLVLALPGSTGCTGAAMREPTAASGSAAGKKPSSSTVASAGAPEAPAQRGIKPPGPPAAAGAPPDKPVPSNASPETEPPAIVIRQMEIYGSITFRAGKALGMRSLVMTREEPPPAGSEGTLFRKVEVAGKASEWIPIARVTLKKFETSGQVQFVIVEELTQPPASAGAGKPAPGNAFGKGMSVKAQMTL